MSETNAQEQWDAQQLQQAFAAHKQSRGRFGGFQPPWTKIESWVSLVRKAFEKGVTGGDNILACMLTANSDRTLQLAELHRLVSSSGFQLVASSHALQPGEADEMRELGINPNDPTEVQKFRVRDYIKGALRKIAGVAETTDVNARIFVHYLVQDITATPAWLRYLLGWKHIEVERECGEEAREFFKEKRHIAKACVALGFPKEIIAPDFEL